MIDVYWTVIPVMLVHYFASHPLGEYNKWRSMVVVILTWVWSVRLTHNYFRRENWEWGAREDWRFNDLRKQYGKHWWWLSFFSVYVSQQVKIHQLFDDLPQRVDSHLVLLLSLFLWKFAQIFLIGICLPLYTIHSVDAPLNIWDFVSSAICLTGIVMAYFADTQLHEFVTQNQKLKEQGKPKIPNLDTGLWYYSRHPNYLGEQLWWWGLVVFAWNLGQGWTLIGALVNTLCLVYVTILVERRMVKQEYRAEAYRAYQKTTSVWIPWFKSQVAAAVSKDKSTWILLAWLVCFNGPSIVYFLHCFFFVFVVSLCCFVLSMKICIKMGLEMGLNSVIYIWSLFNLFSMNILSLINK